MPLFDTHTHAYYPPLADISDEVVDRMRRADVLRAVQIGTSVEHSLAAISLAEAYLEYYRATVGYHPVDAQEIDYDTPKALSIRAQLEDIFVDKRSTIVAIGETGVDRHYLESGRGDLQLENQKKWFAWHARLAQQYDLALVIHSREAPRETIDWIVACGVKKAIIHCFAENLAFAEELMGYSEEIVFSFSGILTYKSALDIQNAAAHIPLSKILIETDAPWLAPHSIRGQTNDSSRVRETFEKLCSLRSETPAIIEQTLWENSQRVYGWC